MAAVGAGEIEFVVKNPSRPSQEDTRIRVPASGTVRDLKLRLQADYPGHPEPATITVRRETTMADVQGRVELPCEPAAPPAPCLPVVLEEVSPFSTAPAAGHLCRQGAQGPECCAI